MRCLELCEGKMRQSENSTAAAAAAQMDTISSLPDDILCRILSFVPTKEAVATSVLSKRWTHLWHYVPNLHFINIRVDSPESSLRFNKFVDSVLASRDAAGSNFIHDFHFYIQYVNPPDLGFHLGLPNFNEWLNLAVQRCRLKYLHLNLRVFDGHYQCLPNLPVSIFTCTTLVSLNLSNHCVNGFSFSIGFRFPSLKTLHLDLIQFSEVRDFLLFLVGCPILEDLLLCDIYFSGEEDFLTLQELKNLDLPKLTRAYINQCSCSYFMWKAFSTSVSLHIDKSTLYATHTEVNRPQRPYDDIPTCHNLTHLELHYNLDLVAQLLHHFPKLQSLELYREVLWNEEEEEEDDDDDDDDESWVEPESIPQCMSSYLRTCTIWNVSGLQCELLLSKYILKNAKKLQTMTIWSKGEPLEIERKLSPCIKASATCKLSVHR